jgi:hypothetical protein
MKSRTVGQKDDLLMTLTIKSQQHPSFYLPDTDQWGFIGDPVAFYLIQLQKKAGDKYVNIKLPGHLDNIPNFRLDTVGPNQERRLDFALYILQSYIKGEYRVRVLCKLSLYNHLKDRYSNWTYFTCIKDINPF